MISLFWLLLASSALAQPFNFDQSSLQSGKHDTSPPSLQDLWGQDWPFTGIPTFAHLNTSKCLLNPDINYDIGIIGIPFDTATTYRPGARFGPRAIRDASQRQNSMRGFNTRAGINPYEDWATFMDCGDIPVTPMDNKLALEQMTKAFEELLLRRNSSADSSHPPRYVALGGDHSVILPHLRALNKLYGKLAVIHFDAHLDTWLPSKYPSSWSSEQSKFTHGSMLWMASEEGLLSDNYNAHIGIRTRISGADWDDFRDDDDQGWLRFSADDVWTEGIDGLKTIVSQIKKRIPKDYPVYISVDVDCMDPGFTPGTGTIEPGGMMPREVIYLLRHLDLDLVGADVVEVSPAFDHAEITSTNAAQIVYELITTMVQRGMPLPLRS
ncbi:Guanidinobutyrase [Brettanomyces nanus]|uniref:Guanidinobutyrase n=1 Tax=Eeniella nana TaxID=13502 RepID=A0A875RUT0_EENNA|nr:Guanidinobutyrase [Brettanomyces nanus]QPG74917.1 Guanidinobutyrase [Brettanomyces nanus]